MKNVHSKEDVIKFYDIYYPYYTKEMKLSIADYFSKIVSGDAQLPTYLNRATEDNKWDFKKDLEEEKMDAKIRLTEKRISEMLKE